LTRASRQQKAARGDKANGHRYKTFLNVSSPFGLGNSVA
jgi:hypothetical protein